MSSQRNSGPFGKPLIGKNCRSPVLISALLSVRHHLRAAKGIRPLLFILVAGVSLLFFIGGPGYDSPRSFQCFWNLGHIFYFSLLPVLFTRHLSGSFPKQCLRVLGMILPAGILIELVQAGFQRTPDAGDLARNMIGGMVFLFFLFPARKTLSKIVLRFFQSATLVLIAVHVYPLAAALTDEYIAHRQFPVLSDFETPFEIKRWVGKAITVDKAIHLHGKASLRMTLNTDRYSGISLKYFPGNWEGFRFFTFGVYNPSAESVTLTCRIHDAVHTHGVQRYRDRFNRSLLVKKGWNTFRIPLDEVRSAPSGRQMDMHRICGLGLFASRLPHPITLYIDGVRLIR